MDRVCVSAGSGQLTTVTHYGIEIREYNHLMLGFDTLPRLFLIELWTLTSFEHFQANKKAFANVCKRFEKNVFHTNLWINVFLQMFLLSRILLKQ